MLKKKVNVPIWSAAILCLLFLGLLIYAFIPEKEENTLWSKDEWRSGKMYIHNSALQDDTNNYSVDKAAVKEQIIELCSHMTPFRQKTGWDTFHTAAEAGKRRSNVYMILDTGNAAGEKYTVNFIDVSEQLSFENINRESLVLEVRKSARGDAGEEQTIYTWYCTMPAELYVELLNIMSFYTQATVITPTQK